MARWVDIDPVVKKIEYSLSLGGAGDYNSGYDAALNAVLDDIDDAPTLTPPNEPLSIEQLREMDGEPVWVVYDQDAAKTTPGFDPLTLWALVEVTKTSVFLTNNFGGRTVYADDQDLEWAGITVYRRPPEGEV